MGKLIEFTQRAKVPSVSTSKLVGHCAISVSTTEFVGHRATPEKKKRVRGRAAQGLPDRRKAQWKVGDQHGKLTILGEMGRDKRRNLLVACQCDCGNQTLVRLDKLRSKDPKVRTTSCGCVKIANFLKFHDDQAQKWRTEVEKCKRIFTDRLHGVDARTIAEREGLAKPLVDAIFRMEANAAKESKLVPMVLSMAAQKKDYAAIAARTGMLPSTVAWLVKQHKQAGSQEAAA